MKGCRALSEEEVTLVLRELETLRDKTMFLIGVKCGMRISEILSLNICDVVEYGKVGNEVRLAKKSTKGKVESRVIPLTESARAIIQEYLTSMGSYDPKGPLFKSAKGQNRAISTVQAHRILKKAFRSLELKGNCSSHSLRKTYAQRVHKDMGEKLELTQMALGHKNITSTVQYIKADWDIVKAAILRQG